LTKGVPEEGAEGGAAALPNGQIFLLKKSISEKNWYFWAKKWDFAPPDFFLLPSKISPGYALGFDPYQKLVLLINCKLKFIPKLANLFFNRFVKITVAYLR